MSYAGILATVNLYKSEKNQLTSDLSDILMNITDASKKTADLTAQETEKKSYVRENYDKEDTEYQVQMDEINAEFEDQLSQVNAWESELEQQKQAKETQVQMTSSYLDSFTEVLKNNVKKDFTYGQGK